MRTVNNLTLFVLGITLLASCASTSDVMSTGSIQKRKYRKGYHVDFRKKKQAEDVAQYTASTPNKAEVSQPESSNFDVEQPEIDLSLAEPLVIQDQPAGQDFPSEALPQQEPSHDVKLSGAKAAPIHESPLSSRLTPTNSPQRFTLEAATLENLTPTEVTSFGEGNLKKTGIALMLIGLVSAVVGTVLAAGSASVGSAGGFGIGALLSWLGWLIFLVGLVILIVYLVQ